MADARSLVEPPGHGRYVVECAGIQVARKDLAEARRLADLQEKRHSRSARIFDRHTLREINRNV